MHHSTIPRHFLGCRYRRQHRKSSIWGWKSPWSMPLNKRIAYSGQPNYHRPKVAIWALWPKSWFPKIEWTTKHFAIFPCHSFILPLREFLHRCFQPTPPTSSYSSSSWAFCFCHRLIQFRHLLPQPMANFPYRWFRHHPNHLLTRSCIFHKLTSK